MTARVTVAELLAMKRRGERIVMLTAYDYPTARLIDQAGIPVILVGDSLGNTVLGYETTIPVTLADMLHHTKAVTRAARRALVVADMPFLTYQVTPEEALRNAGRLVQEGGAHAVKVEGGGPIVETVARLVRAGIPVMGHLGLTPQSVHALGGFRLQARTASAVEQLFADALALEEAGAFAIVLELVPAPVARAVSELLRIPTIGIGAGAGCDGQVQVLTDLLGLTPGPLPRHARAYADLASIVSDAVRRFAEDVRDGAFPSEAESFGLPRDLDVETVEAIARAYRARRGGSGDVPRSDGD
ncbi:MAG: 3-methyl-2-oxobutanoate hydroxymethyltransferase [Thermomicrobium sp.]|nr:3-methyl-2-oxobutanoate hydroxymethyltransferase [Thermomicrobium sp.]